MVTLERNYRSTQPILDASNAVIALAAERYTKNLWTDAAVGRAAGAGLGRATRVEQARCVADRVLEQREAGVTLKAQAVLFRASHHSARWRSSSPAATSRS